MSIEKQPSAKAPEPGEDKPAIWHDRRIGAAAALLVVIVVGLWLFLSHSKAHDVLVSWIMRRLGH